MNQTDQLLLMYMSERCTLASCPRVSAELVIMFTMSQNKLIFYKFNNDSTVNVIDTFPIVYSET